MSNLVTNPTSSRKHSDENSRNEGVPPRVDQDKMDIRHAFDGDDTFAMLINLKSNASTMALRLGDSKV